MVVLTFASLLTEYLRNVGFVLMFTLSLFGVLGIQLFGGALTFRCHTSADIIRDSSGSSAGAGPVPIECPGSVQCPEMCVQIAGDSVGDGMLELSGSTDRLANVSASDLTALDVDTIFRITWGFDKISDAMLTGWIVTTGDMWGVDMLHQMEQSDSRYKNQARLFFIVMALVVSMVIGNLFSAVIVHAYFANRVEVQDQEALQERLHVEKALFRRLDVDGRGEIAVDRILGIADLMGLEDTHFAQREMKKAVQDLDIDGNATVDLDEFIMWWRENSTFVVKLKKALRRQEAKIREVWTKIDADGSEALSRDEIGDMAKQLGIVLSAAELKAAVEEMGADMTAEVSYSVFVAWWLSRSKIAGKVRRATQSIKNNADGRYIFDMIDADNSGEVTVSNIVERAVAAFGRVVTRAEALTVLREGAPEGSASMTIDDFEHWWVSDRPYANELRRKRTQDINNIRELLDHCGASRVNELAAQSVDAEVLANVRKALRLASPVADIVDSIKSANPDKGGDAWINKDSGDLSVNTMEFYRFMCTQNDPVATNFRDTFVAYQTKLEHLMNQPFPFIPVISPLCSALVKNPKFDLAIFGIIVFNVVILACQYHEMEKDFPNVDMYIYWLEVFFAIVFGTEAIVKIVGLGAIFYFEDSGNRFDFFCVCFIVAEYIMIAVRDTDKKTGASGLRGIRVLVKSLRVVRSARILANNHAVRAVIKTVTESGEQVIVLSAFAVFMLCVLSIVGGQTLGSCFTLTDGSAGPDMPQLNFYTFFNAFHANFLVLMGVSWSPIMFDYMECASASWVYFVLVFVVMNFFVANLFMALLVDGFSLSEEEKLAKQETNYIKQLRSESEIFSDGAAVSVASFGDVGRNGLPKARDVLKNMTDGVRVTVREDGKQIPDRHVTSGLDLQQNKKLEASWGCIAMDSPVRVFCIALVDTQEFETVILTIVMISAVAMAAEGPPGSIDRDSGLYTFFLVVNVFTLLTFWFEFIVKTIANGFISTPAAYLSDSWNRLDIFVLISSTVEFVADRLSTDNANASRILRVLRILKPLRLIKHNESMQVLLDALRHVIPIMAGVTVLMLLYYTIFAILGMGLFIGSFGFCNCDGRWNLPVPEPGCTDTEITVKTGKPGYMSLGKEACIAQGGSWENPPYNFDNFFSALRALFFCAVGDGQQIIRSGMDVTQVDEAPLLDNSSFYAAFFWVFMLFSNFFLMNILIGILTSYFLESNGSALLTERQSEWSQVQLTCLMTDPFSAPAPDEGTLRRVAHDLVTHKYFEPIVTAAILINVGALFLERTPQDESVASGLHVVEQTCLWFFTFDVSVRVSSLGLGNYLRDNWSKLDFVIVASSWLSQFTGVTSALSSLRALRVLRVVLLMKNYDTMQPIIRALLLSIPAVTNVVGLIGLVLFVFSIASMNLFGIQPQGEFITSLDNFDSFGNAFQRLSQICTGQDTMNLVYELENNGATGAFFFVFMFTVVIQLLYINLFVVILVDSFMRSLVMAKLEVREEHVQAFKKVWSQGRADPGGPYKGRPFTKGPQHESIDIRLLQDFVPLLLPSTESIDRKLSAMSDGLGSTVESLVEHSPLSLLQDLAGFATHAPSPLGMMVPHRVKHPHAVAAPFVVGSVAHVHGRLCEIVEPLWDSDADRDSGKYPSKVVVRWIESPLIDIERLQTEDGKPVAAIEGRFAIHHAISGATMPCEITWVSENRQQVKVRFESSNWEAGVEHKRLRKEQELEKELAEELLEAGVDTRSLTRTASYGGMDSEMGNGEDMGEATAGFSSNKPGQDAKNSVYLQDGTYLQTEVKAAKDVKRVTMAGDPQWMNRLMMELEINADDARKGYSIVQGRGVYVDEFEGFLPRVVGFRQIIGPQGKPMIVQNIMISFHQLLLGLSLIHCSYDGLTFKESQSKWDLLRSRAEQYAARVIQTVARCKLAKRHLVKAVQHGASDPALDHPDSIHLRPTLIQLSGLQSWPRPSSSELQEHFEKEQMRTLLNIYGHQEERKDEFSFDVQTKHLASQLQDAYKKKAHKIVSKVGPMAAWADFHRKWGKFDSYDDCEHWAVLLDMQCSILLRSMKTCFGVKTSTAVFQHKTKAEILQAEETRLELQQAKRQEEAEAAAAELAAKVARETDAAAEPDDSEIGATADFNNPLSKTASSPGAFETGGVLRTEAT